MPLVALSELDAVNTMLISIGQAPVNTLVVSGIRDVAIAKSILLTTSREVQNVGWDFNVDTQLELMPDEFDHLLVPANSLRIEPTDPSKRYVVRENGGTLMFWDLSKHTFDMPAEPVKVDVVWFFGFESIPQYARNYIATKAARRFQAYSVGSQILYQYTLQDEQDAFAELKRNSSRVKNVNILRDGDWTNQIFQRRHGIAHY